jgi:hypothetical protein
MLLLNKTPRWKPYLIDYYIYLQYVKKLFETNKVQFLWMESDAPANYRFWSREIQRNFSWWSRTIFSHTVRFVISKMMPSGPYLSGVITLRQWLMKSQNFWQSSDVIEHCLKVMTPDKKSLGIIFDISLVYRIFIIRISLYCPLAFIWALKKRWGGNDATFENEISDLVRR